MNISVKSKFTEASMLKARNWHWKSFGSLQYWWLVVGLVCIVAGFLIIFIKGPPSPSSSFLLGYSFIFGIYCLFRKKILEWLFRKNLKKIPGYGFEIEWLITKNYFKQKSHLGSSESLWSGIYETVFTPDGFLIYPQKKVYYWLPNDGFENLDDINVLRELLIKKTKHKEIT